MRPLLRNNQVAKIAVGIVAGIVSGLCGGGGGMIVVPLLCSVMKLEEKKAHATAVAVILPVSIVSAVVYLMKVPYDIPSGLFVTLGVVSGGVIGSYLLKVAPTGVVSIVFSLMMLVGGVKLAFF